MTIDNAVLHYYQDSPYIVKAAVNLRNGSKIMLRLVLRDNEACEKYLNAHFPDIPRKHITHM